MARRGRRVRLARGIYRDKSGTSVVLWVGGQRHERRFPSSWSVHELRRAAEQHRRQLVDELAETVRGSLGALVETYLDGVPAGPARRDRSALLTPWLEALGHDVALPRVTARALQTAADNWRAAGCSANRINKRISALRIAWRRAGPAGGRSPADQVTRYTEPLPETRGIPMTLVQRILDAVVDDAPHKRGTPAPPSRSKARLRVLAWTGQPPARVMAIERKDVRWDTDPPLLYVRPRRKGSGSADAWLPLLPQAAAALRDFFAAGATGRFEASALGRTLTRAVRVVQRELRTEGDAEAAARLDGFRTYDLRHSFLTALAELTHDPYVVAEYAGHANLQTTRRYIRGARLAKMTEGIEELATALGVPRSGATVRPRKTPRGATKRHMAR